MFHNSTQAVAVSSNDDVVVFLQTWEYFTFPIRHHTGNGVFQRFGAWYVGIGHLSVASVLGSAVGIVFCQWVRGHIEAATPDEHLLIAEFGSGLGLVQALQVAVVLFVQAP